MIDANTIKLPCWDMSTLYPNIESTEFTSEIQATVEAIDEFEVLCDQYHVGHQLSTTLDDDTVTSFEKILVRYNKTLETVEAINNYLRHGALLTANFGEQIDILDAYLSSACNLVVDFLILLPECIMVNLQCYQLYLHTLRNLQNLCEINLLNTVQYLNLLTERFQLD